MAPCICASRQMAGGLRLLQAACIASLPIAQPSCPLYHCCSVLERALADLIPPFTSDKQAGELPLRTAHVRCRAGVHACMCAWRCCQRSSVCCLPWHACVRRCPSPAHTPRPAPTLPAPGNGRGQPRQHRARRTAAGRHWAALCGDAGRRAHCLDAPGGGCWADEGLVDTGETRAAAGGAGVCNSSASESDRQAGSAPYSLRGLPAQRPCRGRWNQCSGRRLC